MNITSIIPIVGGRAIIVPMVVEDGANNIDLAGRGADEDDFELTARDGAARHSRHYGANTATDIDMYMTGQFVLCCFQQASGLVEG